MRIAILTSGVLPVPAQLGGAVENLIDFYLASNSQMHKHSLTVYSIAPPQGTQHLSSLPSSHADTSNQYQYINDRHPMYKFRRKLFGLTYRPNTPYYYHIEYFLHRALRQMAKQKNPYDLILIENRPGYIPTVARTYPHIPIVLHLHNDFLHPQIPQAAHIKECCKLIIPVSKYIRSRVDAIAAPSQCRVCYNGIDLTRFRIPQARQQTRAKWGLNDTDFVVVYSGRMIEEKGVRELIEAFVLLAPHSHIKLLMIGGSFYGNQAQASPYMQELQKAAANCGTGRIHFTGFVAYEQMPSLLSAADVGIVPSIWEEPFALTCAEGLAAGLPLIVTRSGGIPEVVDEQCAIILDKESDGLPQRIADAIVQLSQHPQTCQAMSHHARQRAVCFGKERYTQRFFELIESVRTS